MFKGGVHTVSPRNGGGEQSQNHDFSPVNTTRKLVMISGTGNLIKITLKLGIDVRWHRDWNRPIYRHRQGICVESQRHSITDTVMRGNQHWNQGLTTTE